MKIKALSFVLLAIVIAGCAPIQKEAPVIPNFTFNPPSTTPPTRNAMSIAILLPGGKGAFWNSFQQDGVRRLINDFFRATQTDLEKTIISKGFTSAGDFASFDEMTYSQKERSSLVMRPEINLDITITGSSSATGTGSATLDLLTGQPAPTSVATVTGSIVIEFLEPMSKEKVWVKRIELPPTVQNVRRTLLRRADGTAMPGPDGLGVSEITQNSATALLNSFYATAFSKIWDQLDPRELAGLKFDADKLKKSTNYRAN